MQAQERNFSVDDLVGGIWRLGQAAGGFHRTDSEAAFQEFLKRIPSASNLAAGATQLDSASAAQIQHQIHGVLPASSGLVSNSDVVGGGLVLGAMPRVPSLDFLRQLASVQQQISVGSSPQIKLESHTPPPGVLGLSGLSAVDLQSLASSSPLSALQAVPSLNTGTHPLAASLHNPAAAAAAALQLNEITRYHTAAVAQQQQRQQQQTQGGRNVSESQSDDDDDDGKDGNGDKSEVRRARRMLSNRESARRSRRRKQDHLNKLESEINVLLEEKKAWSETTLLFERRCSAMEDDNRRLKEENDRLRDELGFLRTELTESGFGRRSGRSEDEAPTAKRSRTEDAGQLQDT